MSDERGATTPGRAAARKAARRRQRRRTRRVAVWSVAGIVLLCAGAGYYEYQSLNSKLSGSSLHASGDSAAGAPQEIVDRFGRSPINVLVIGSDSRLSQQDCKLGGSTCGGAGGQRADVEMVLHVSADRSNATVMSIPRDLDVPLPACAGGGTNKINSALQTSPGCQVDAVEKATRIPIDHFIEVDFGGVVAVSNAIGGVPVCVSSELYDRNSGLKLTAGHHVLSGQSALQFMRTRDAFNDGSDLKRTGTQHQFLAWAIKQLESSGAVSDPTKILSLTSGVVSSLRVDDEIKSLPKLASLAWDIHKVPTDRITFVTMQTGYVGKTLVPAAGATDLFHAIAQDQAVSTAAAPGGTASASASAGSGASRAAGSGSPAPHSSRTASGAATGALAGASHQTAAEAKDCATVGNVENIPVGLGMRNTAAGQRVMATPEPGTTHHQMYCGPGPEGINCYATPRGAYTLFPQVKNSAP